MKERTETPETSAVAATSSTPRVLPGEQEALFREVLLLLEKAGCAYAVAGAFALREHTGICRFTKDLDVFLTTRTASEVLPIFEQHGFRCEVCDSIWLAKVHRDGYFVDCITGMSNGIIVVKDSWIEHAHPAQVCGVSSRVLAPEEMVVSKLFVTRRERFDGADIAHIIFALKGKLDWNRILRLAGDHWELVLWNLILFRYVYPAQADYVPQDLWQELLGRVSKTVQSPEATPRFRGTLVDDAMFAIDVEEWGLDNLLAEQRSQTAKIEPRSQPQRTNSKLRAS